MSFGWEDQRPYTKRRGRIDISNMKLDEVMESVGWDAARWSQYSGGHPRALVRRLIEEYPEYDNMSYLIWDCTTLTDPHHDPNLRSHTRVFILVPFWTSPRSFRSRSSYQWPLNLLSFWRTTPRNSYLLLHDAGVEDTGVWGGTVAFPHLPAHARQEAWDQGRRRPAHQPQDDYVQGRLLAMRAP